MIIPVQHLEEFQKQVGSLNISSAGDYTKVLDFMIKAYCLGYEDAKRRYATVYPAEVMEIFNENSKKDT